MKFIGRVKWFVLLSEFYEMYCNEENLQHNAYSLHHQLRKIYYTEIILQIFKCV